MSKRIAGWFRPKSNGVPVSRAAFSYIRSGDAARAQGRWRDAADAYRAALAAMPGLAHVWVQYAHASKEAGDRAAATDAYRRAAALGPADPEPHMHLGHLAKRAGTGGAARHYLDALRRAPGDLGAIGEVMQQLLATRQSDVALIDEALTLLDIPRERLDLGASGLVLAPGTIALDVSDVLAFFTYSRLPSGVQRVQIEVILALLEANRASIALCCHSAPHSGWIAVSTPAFRDLCVASLSADGAGWDDRLRVIQIARALSSRLAFPPRSTLVSFSPGLPDPNYLLDLRTASAREGLMHVPLMYDLIPILFPEAVVANNARNFAAWIASLVPVLRGFVAISAATRDDVRASADRAGYPVATTRVRVLRLDGDIRKRDNALLPATALAALDLAPGGYVLFVSTIEPRKNHVGAFAAWLRLARELGERAVPTLVCVGGKGWLNDEVHAMLASEPLLRRKVRILSGISDPQLDLLYRACAFTLYPSFYEGWGLPVTESLCHGKLPVVSNTSSLPEAGGRFAVYFDPHDTDSMVDAIRPLIRDPAALAAHEATIREGFRPRSWLAIGDELLAHARAIAEAAREEGERVPAAALGTLASLAAADRIAADAVDGEVFRFGAGWSGPGDEGCRIDGTDAWLRFAVPEGATTARIDLRAGDAAVDFRVGSAHGTLSPGERRGVAIALSDRGVAEIAVAVDGHGDLVVEGFAVLG